MHDSVSQCTAAIVFLRAVFSSTIQCDEACESAVGKCKLASLGNGALLRRDTIQCTRASVAQGIECQKYMCASSSALLPPGAEMSLLERRARASAQGVKCACGARPTGKETFSGSTRLPHAQETKMGTYSVTGVTTFYVSPRRALHARLQH